LAYHATDGNKKRIAAAAGRRATNAAAEQSVAEEQAASLRQVTLNFTAKAGEGDRLFGSITAGDIAAKLAAAGHKVDKRSIELQEPIRTIGTHQVPIRLHSAVRAEIRVQVGKEQG
jgi:large subunit ribosomal protein L9